MRNIKIYSKKYLEDGFEHYQIKYRRKKILDILTKIAGNHDLNILDIGCGNDPLFLYTPKTYRYTIVEPSKIFIEKVLRENANFNNTIINDYFNEEIINKLPSRNYDVIICSSLLHEIEDPLSMLKTIKKVCSNNTIVHINVPNAKSIHRLLAKESKKINSIYDFSNRNIELMQNNVYDLEKMIKLVSSSGFEILEYGTFFIKPFSHNQMDKLLKEKIIDENVLDGFYNLEKYLPEYGSEIYINCKKR